MVAVIAWHAGVDLARVSAPEGATFERADAYFAVKYHKDASFNADIGVAHERTEIRNQNGEALGVDLWTGCYTPRELRLMLSSAGLEVREIFSIEPGAYLANPPSLESPEHMVIAFRPPS